MRARKSPPSCRRTGEASTNRKEKRMQVHHTPDSVGDAITRIEDLLELRGLPRRMWSIQTDPENGLYLVTSYLPEGWTHPAAKGRFIQWITIDYPDLLTALVVLGDKLAEATRFQAAS